MTDRATLEETLEFANKVREAGGGNPLNALMPAVPEEPYECLIAKNLNFNCRVDGTGGPDNVWYMALDSYETAQTIAETLDLYYMGFDKSNDQHRVRLPERIGQVAADFDRAGSLLDRLDSLWVDYWNYRDEPEEFESTYESFREFIEDNDPSILLSDDDHGSLENLQDMLPYILAAIDETEQFGFIKDGKLVL